MVDGMFLSYLFHRVDSVECVLFSDPQKHVQGVKNVISGTAAIIH